MRLTSAAARLVSAAALVASMAVGTVPASAEDAPPLAPVADAGRVAAYVQYVYEDLFGREPDPTGTDTWTRALLGGTPRVAVANAITASDEFRLGRISDAYEGYLGRQPDAGGLRFWLGEMARGRTIAQLQAGFVASDEYWLASGATPSGWVTTLYQHVLDRDPAPDEVGFWVRRIGAGATRGEVALGFLLSTEHLSTVVDGYYEWLLGRGLDPVGQRTWVGILQAGGRDEAIIGGIVGSQEYWDLVTDPDYDPSGDPGEPADPPLAVMAIRIEGPSAPVPAGYGVAFTVLGLDAQGQAVVDLTAEATIARDGIIGVCYRGACNLATTVGQHTMTATWWSLTASTAVTVVVGPPATVWLSVPSTVSAGEPFSVRVTGADAGGNDLGPLAPTVTVDGGGSCAGTTCTFTSAGLHTVDAAVGSAHGTISFYVAPGSLARMDVSPSSATVTSGAGQTYHVRGYDRFGNESPEAVQAATFTVDGAPCPAATCATTALGNHTVVATAGGVTRTAALSVVAPGPTASRLFGWGLSTTLGTGGPNDRATPLTEVGVDTHWVSVASSAQHTLGITSDGALWSWGIAPVGDGGEGGALAPVHVGTDRWSAVAAPGNHVLAVRRDGSLWTWGYDLREVLGFDPSFLATPKRVGTRTDWVGVSGTPSSSAALARDGSLWTWGDNGSGQLGHPSAGNGATPREVSGGHRWLSASGGCGHMVAIAEDGTLWAWGDDSRGQLGVGTGDVVTVPTQVGTATTWATVSAGCEFTVATRADGTLWAWGANDAGQLGTGDQVDRPSPTRIGLGTSWIGVSAGGRATHALSAGGALWGWGANSDLQATGEPSSGGGLLTPTRIGTGTGWTALAGGDRATFALRP